MTIQHEASVQNEYIWKCVFCFYAMAVNKSTIVSKLSVREFDTSLTLWLMSANSLTTARMINEKSQKVVKPVNEYFKIFRKAHSHYVKKMIRPFLVLTGPLEIDESKVNTLQRFNTVGAFVSIRWMFGMFCRNTKIMLVYVIKEKSARIILPLMKQHIAHGSTIFSDTHASYVNLSHNCS